MDITHRRHTNHFSERIEICNRERIEDLFIADKSGGLAIAAGDIETVVIMNILVARLHLAADLAHSSGNFTLGVWRIIRPASGSQCSELFCGKSKFLNI